MNKDIKRVLLDKEELAAAVKKVAGEVNAQFVDEPVLAIIIL